ncbi:hypothetical protein C8Q76DRAFT_796759 [Earliella scabrosa]|nr:hypothetical protein C8Q76DRAFT_796759 [Earliella scabrosa]
MDVMHLIACWSTTHTLTSLLLTSRLVNELLTPILYSVIELDSWDDILKCLATLALPAEACVYDRDLPLLARSFIIRRPSTRRPFYTYHDSLPRNFLRTITRMRNLRLFSSNTGLGLHAPDILYTFLSGICPRIASVEVGMGMGDCVMPDFDDVETLSLNAPTLRTLKLAVPMNSTPLMSLVRKFLSTHAASLQSLSLVPDLQVSVPPEDEFTFFIDRTLPPNATYPALEDLEAGCAALLHPSLIHARHVRSLTLTTSWPEPCSVPPGLFPALEELSCPTVMLPIFLDPDPDVRRPIKCVRLDNTKWEGPWRRSLVPKWDKVLASLELLQYSAAPVTTVGFQVKRIPLRGFADARPHLTSVEELVIIVKEPVSQEWLYRLAADLVAHTPRLHTLLVSQHRRGRAVDPHGPEDGLERATHLARKALPEFASRCPALARVAFCMDVELRRESTGTWWVWRWMGEGCPLSLRRWGYGRGWALYAEDEDEDEEERDSEIGWDGMDGGGFAPHDDDPDPDVEAVAGAEGPQQGDTDGQDGDSDVEDTRFLPPDHQIEDPSLAEDGNSDQEAE